MPRLHGCDGRFPDFLAKKSVGALPLPGPVSWSAPTFFSGAARENMPGAAPPAATQADAPLYRKFNV